jgi:two-component system, NtrC family, response regulator PilR
MTQTSAVGATSATTPARVLIIDDEPDLRTLYELTLLREGYRVEAAADLAEARTQLREHRFDAVITDMRLPDGLGMELLRETLDEQRPERFVVITAYGSAENAVEALKAGAFDYLTKPVDLKQFRTVVASAIAGTRSMGVAQKPMGGPVRAANDGAIAASSATSNAAPFLDRLVGNSAAMLAVKARIAKVSGSMAPILIQGESGTGKELVARAVHACSHRASGPFVAVNCSAIPENLLEAEFFGARKGAYTGSAQDRLGYFQSAKAGTLFLDEIGDLPLAMQSKLLRAIQERTVRPLGSTQEDTVDVRIVSATHKDLGQGVQTGSFRQDLFYRLNVIEINVPPLRDRREDLPALCQALLERICGESGMPVPTLAPAMISQMGKLSFQGNVRELENMLHRAVALGDEGSLYLDNVPAESADVAVPENLQDFLDAQERGILVKVLQETGFNRTAAAARLGLSLRQIRYRIARLNIDAPHDEDAAQADEPATGDDRI